jgi:hypothetical protein
MNELLSRRYYHEIYHASFNCATTELDLSLCSLLRCCIGPTRLLYLPLGLDNRTRSPLSPTKMRVLIAQGGTIACKSHHPFLSSAVWRCFGGKSNIISREAAQATFISRGTGLGGWAATAVGASARKSANGYLKNFFPRS